MIKRSAVQERLYRIIFKADTAEGKLFDVLLFIAISLSVGLTMLQSVKSIDEQHGSLLFVINAFLSVAFTIEYFIRIYCARHSARYVRSFFGVVDLVALLPFYVGLFIPSTRFLDVVRILRMLRIFRVLKMAQYVGEADLLKNALVSSRRKIGIFLVTVMTIVVIVGSLMYVIEGETHGFSSIPRSVYWAIVTVTTVGYGDISPETPLGQTLAAVLMIIAYSIIAVPTGIITAEISASTVKQKTGRKCERCGRLEIDPDARFCKSCGKKFGLPEPVRHG